MDKGLKGWAQSAAEHSLLVLLMGKAAWNYRQKGPTLLFRQNLLFYMERGGAQLRAGWAGIELKTCNFACSTTAPLPHRQQGESKMKLNMDRAKLNYLFPGLWLLLLTIPLNLPAAFQQPGSGNLAKPGTGSFLIPVRQPWPKGITCFRVCYINATLTQGKQGQ